MIFVIIPSFKVTNHILSVLEQVPKIVDKIFVVDDCCPDNSGKFVQENCKDPRVNVLFHKTNKGVGGAMITGYREVLKTGTGIAIKLDGDGQMDPAFIPELISPILKAQADYTKGNRFYFIRALKGMPLIRIFGNTGLSFINKIVTGYWNIMDPTNGYTAIHTKSLNIIPLERIANNYFFESDMLFRLSTINAVVRDVPMLPVYEDEKSNLSISITLQTFPFLYLTRFLKRIVYNYYIRDFNLGSLFLMIGIFSTTLGLTHGFYHWYLTYAKGVINPTGTIMIPAISLIIGFQSILFFLQNDISMIPRIPLFDEKDNL